MGNLDKFDHLVVLMLENHSLDSLLGYLYEDGAPANFIGDFGGAPAFDGVAGKDLSNPGPPGTPPVPVQRAPFATQLDMCNPYPDPGEELPHINVQLYGDEHPSEEALASPAPMNGFVKDYVKVLEGPSLGLKKFTVDEYRVIMSCFPPDAVPVLSGLARAFAVSDRWFCSVPSQTFCNRSFFHSGQSHGFVTNADYIKWHGNDAPTILNRLSDKGVSWRVYFDPTSVLSATRSLHPPIQGPSFDDNFRSFDEFRADCESGKLPAYTFIEPRLLWNHNDMHPPVFLNPFIDSSILAGEKLVNDVYEAVRANPDVWRKTLLIITFDEHGGCYDHVPPPRTATPPVSPAPYALQDDFPFDRFGVRVPAIFVSPFIEAGTVIRSSSSDLPFDHTTVIRTLCEKHGLDPLLARDARAPSLEPLLTRADPRDDAPTLTPRPYVPTPEPLASALPLTPFQQDMLGLFSHSLSVDVPEAAHDIGQASEHLASSLKKARGGVHGVVHDVEQAAEHLVSSVKDRLKSLL